MKLIQILFQITIADLSIFSTVCAIDILLKINDGKSKWPKLCVWYQEMCSRPSYAISILPGLTTIRDIVKAVAKFPIK